MLILIGFFLTEHSVVFHQSSICRYYVSNLDGAVGQLHRCWW